MSHRRFKTYRSTLGDCTTAFQSSLHDNGLPLNIVNTWNADDGNSKAYFVALHDTEATLDVPVHETLHDDPPAKLDASFIESTDAASHVIGRATRFIGVYVFDFDTEFY